MPERKCDEHPSWAKRKSQNAVTGNADRVAGGPEPSYHKACGIPSNLILVRAITLPVISYDPYRFR